MKMNEKKKKRAQRVLFLAAVLLVVGTSVFAADLVPGEVQTGLESVRDAFTGTTAQVILGICFAGSCIAYAYNKDNEKMKAKVIAVMVATGLLALSASIVDTVSKAAAN